MRPRTDGAGPVAVAARAVAAKAVTAVARPVAVAAGLLLGALVTLAAPATPASAHAVLTSAEPAPGAVVATAPATVRLIFNEPVRVAPGRTRVIAPNGKRVHDGDPTGSGTELRITLRATDRPLGTYLVSYRVIAADGHPVAGSFTFSVGAPSAAPRPAGADTHPAVAIALPATKYLGYAGLALAVGPVLLLVTVWPRRLSGRTPVRLARTGLLLLSVATVAGLWLQVPYSTGAGPLDVSPVEIREVLDSRYGAALLARLAIVAAVAALLGRAVADGRPPALRRPADGHPAGRSSTRSRPAGARRAARPVLAALALAGLVTWPLAGHPASSPTPPVSIVADVVHLAAMAVWLGGLLALVPLLRGADRRELAVILPVWSRWAALAVYWLVAGGLVQAVPEVGGAAALTTTAYGRLLLAKAGLLLLLVALAGYARLLVRRSRRRTPTGPPAPTGPAALTGQAAPTVPAAPTGPAGDARRLRRTVVAELGIAALVLVGSAALVQTTPGRDARAEAVAAAGARGFSTTLTCPLYSVQFEIFPAGVGPHNTLHAFLYSPAGTPLEAAEWRVTGAAVEAGLEPIDNPVVTIRGNQGIGAVNFPVPGRWRLRLTIRISETEQATVSTTILVR